MVRLPTGKEILEEQFEFITALRSRVRSQAKELTKMQRRNLKLQQKITRLVKTNKCLMEENLEETAEKDDSMIANNCKLFGSDGCSACHESDNCTGEPCFVRNDNPPPLDDPESVVDELIKKILSSFEQDFRDCKNYPFLFGIHTYVYGRVEAVKSTIILIEESRDSLERGNREEKNRLEF